MRRTIFLPLILAFSVFIAQPHTAIAQGGQDVVRWLEELGRTAGFELTAKDVSQEGDAIVVGSIDIRLSEKIGFSATDARIEGFKTDPSGGVSTSKISVGKITSVGSAAWKITFGDISGVRLSFAATANLPTLLSEEYRQLNAISGVLLSLSAEQLDIASIELDLPEFFQQAQKSIYR
ncbi:MAG: hypothetical protein ACR2OJ_04810, partial [Hyphomicrobiales bacterium]